MSLDWRAFINIWWRHKQTFEYMRIWGVTHLYGVILSLMLNSSFAPLRSLMVLIVYITGRSHSSISLDDKVYLSQLIDARMCGGKIIWLKSSIHTFTRSGVLAMFDVHRIDVASFTGVDILMPSNKATTYSYGFGFPVLGPILLIVQMWMAASLCPTLLSKPTFTQRCHILEASRDAGSAHLSWSIIESPLYQNLANPLQRIQHTKS